MSSRNIRIIMMASAAYTVVSFTKAPRCTSSFIRPSPHLLGNARNLCGQQGGRRGPERRSVCLPDLRARSAAGTSGNDEKHAALVEWTEKQGAFISPKLALGFDAQGTRGWVAREELKVGDLVLSIPCSIEYSGRLSASYVRADKDTGFGAAIR